MEEACERCVRRAGSVCVCVWSRARREAGLVRMDGACENRPGGDGGNGCPG